MGKIMKMSLKKTETEINNPSFINKKMYNKLKQMQQQFNEFKDYEENKDHMSQQKEHFLNSDEKLVGITQDAHSLFRCLAQETWED